MIVYPNAKINIGLNIVRKREDGYHDLETVMYPIPLYDELEINEAEELSLEVEGIKLEDDGKENIVVRAYRMMAEEYAIKPVKIRLVKNIPSGAGLGGGSADAAFMLKALNELYSLGINNDKLRKMASTLGADCALFIENKPMMCKGIGDQMEPVALQLKGYKLILIKPDVNISTADAYRGCKPLQWSTPLEESIKKPICEWKENIKNDFETQVFALYEELAKIKMELYANGAEFALMSGSGSTIYGITKSGDIKGLFPTHKHYILDF